jgi:uncharacterized membrane protein YhaH (DUF805 family)
VAGEPRRGLRGKSPHSDPRSRCALVRRGNRQPETHTFEPTGIFGIAISLIGLANAWIAFALSVKRLHDRDRTGWWLLWQLLIIVLAVFLIIVAIAVPQEQGALWYALAGAAGLAAFVISIWLFVQIGFLRGTQGPNRFGPDPLGPARADAQL